MDQLIARKDELKLFLRSRRAKLLPESFGFRRGERRRTPGLTRDELAQLAGIGTTTYTFLEQGRQINVSVQVLDRIAAVLSLNSQEKRHLFRLAIGELPRVTAISPMVTPELQSMLDECPNCPVFILDRKFDVVARNEAAAIVFGFRASSERRRSNMLIELTSVQAKDQFGENYDFCLRNTIAFFRLRYARYANDDSLKAFVEQLRRQSPKFDKLWNEYDISDGHESLEVLQMNHSSLGPLRGYCKFLMLFGMPEYTICFVIPQTGTNTAEKISAALHRRTA
jgi:transcriptional regulator with XRE-family HTH domain